MRAGADVVYQATFFDGTWRGHADFLLRRATSPTRPTALGPWHYEVADTKLARHVKASAILQICSYVEQLTAIQGVQPESLHVVLGGQRAAHGRAPGRRLHGLLPPRQRGLRGRRRPSADATPAAYPPAGDVPGAGRALRRLPLGRRCARRSGAPTTTSAWSPGITARQRRALKARGVADATRARRPRAADGAAARGRRRRARWSASSEQARIQVAVARTGARSLWELLPLDRDEDGNPVPDRGLLGLPEPSPGDLFLDLEGDPFALDDGVDYLFGILEPRRRTTPASDGNRRRSTRSGARRRRAGHAGRPRRRRSSGTIDLIIDRLGRDPAMHVYHYAAYERTALGRLAQRHGTREEEVDRLLRGGVLVDLFRAVRQGILARRRELLDQADRAAVRAPARGRAQGRRQQHRRLRDLARAGRRGAGRRRRAHPGRDRGLQPRRRREQLAAARLAGGPSARPRGPRGTALPRPALGDGAATAGADRARAGGRRPRGVAHRPACPTTRSTARAGPRARPDGCSPSC